MNILKHIYSRIVEKYIVKHLKTFGVVLKLLEYIVVLHTFLFSWRKIIVYRDDFRRATIPVYNHRPLKYLEAEL